MGAKALTAIRPTGSPHLGNYLGMIRPALEISGLADLGVFHWRRNETRSGVDLRPVRSNRRPGSELRPRGQFPPQLL